LGVDRAARVDQVLGDADAAQPREALRPAPPGHDPEVDLGLPELRPRRRIAEVARERELAAAAEGEPVYGGDRRLRHRLEEAAGLVAERAPALRPLGVEAAHVLDVGPGDERLLARTGEHDGPHVAVVGQLAQTVAQL